MSNPGAAFTRDPGTSSMSYVRTDGELLHQEVRSLLHLLHAQRFVNLLAAPNIGAARTYRFFTVSALGDAAHADKLHPRGIAPLRCLDPIRWVLDTPGLCKLAGSDQGPQGDSMADEQWWYDLKTKSAIQDTRAGKATDRLGPYPSREEAEHAMQKVDERNEAYDHDSRWQDD